jgi:hypothetical protein
MINNKITRKLLFFLPKRIMLWLMENNYTFIMALFYKAFIIKRSKSKHNSPIRNSDKITILALNGSKFRGDLECLSQVNNFRILTIYNNMWQTMLVYYFMKKRKIYSYAFINAEDDSDIGRCRNKINIFFDGFISALLKLIKIDCVITVNYRYLEDLPWVMHFEENGIPHICLFREGLCVVDRFFDSQVGINRRFKGYPVTHIIVHNMSCRDTFLKSGFATEAQVSVCGALRMDNLLKLVNSGNGDLKHRRKRVLLIYFPSDYHLFGKEELSVNDKFSDNAHKYRYAAEGIWPRRNDLYVDLHMSLLHLAMKFPEVDFVIRPKREDIINSWEEYKKVVDESGIDLSKWKNYTVEPDADFHDLIVNSDVIIALQSTAVLEAAIAGKSVIFPLFYGYKETKLINSLHWRDHLDLFDIAESADEMESIIVRRLGKLEISKEIMEGRRRLFEEYFSDLEGVALGRYVDKIKNVVASAKSSGLT